MRHRSTVADLYRLYKEHGPSSTSRMELIDGEIIDMMPPGPLHSGHTDEAADVIRSRIGSTLRLRCQNPVRINKHNEPQPDIAIVEKRDDAYTVAHPTPDDIRLVIEVSDSSLDYDLNTKRLIYAKAEIEEYWVIDVQTRELHLFRRPWQGDYTEHLSFTGDDEIQCSTIQELKVTVRELLPSVTMR
ncbi:MAG: Uma2 family endonuclease [Prosthecobacter sp.]